MIPEPQFQLKFTSTCWVVYQILIFFPHEYRLWFPTNLNQDIRDMRHRSTIQGIKKGGVWKLQFLEA